MVLHSTWKSLNLQTAELQVNRLNFQVNTKDSYKVLPTDTYQINRNREELLKDHSSCSSTKKMKKF